MSIIETSKSQPIPVTIQKPREQAGQEEAQIDTRDSVEISKNEKHLGKSICKNALWLTGKTAQLGLKGGYYLLKGSAIGGFRMLKGFGKGLLRANDKCYGGTARLCMYSAPFTAMAGLAAGASVMGGAGLVIGGIAGLFWYHTLHGLAGAAGELIRPGR